MRQHDRGPAGRGRGGGMGWVALLVAVGGIVLAWRRMRTDTGKAINRIAATHERLDKLEDPEEAT